MVLAFYHMNMAKEILPAVISLQFCDRDSLTPFALNAQTWTSVELLVVSRVGTLAPQCKVNATVQHLLRQLKMAACRDSEPLLSHDAQYFVSTEASTFRSHTHHSAFSSPSTPEHLRHSGSRTKVVEPEVGDPQTTSRTTMRSKTHWRTAQPEADQQRQPRQ